MTLVVAKKLANEILILSDTMLTYDLERPESLRRMYQHYGALKTIIISQELVICFAGEINFAEDAIRKIYKERRNPFFLEGIVELCKDYHEKSGYKTDFIICRFPETKIVRITEGNISYPNDTTFIGNPKAFSRFAEALSSDKLMESIMQNYLKIKVQFYPERVNSEKVNEISKMRACFSFACEEFNDDTGGFCFGVISSKYGFMFLTEIELYNRMNPPLENDKPQAVHFRGSESGSYLHQFLEANQCGNGLMAVYLMGANIGLFYNPARQLRVQILNNLTIDQFRNYLNQEEYHNYPRTFLDMRSGRLPLQLGND